MNLHHCLPEPSGPGRLLVQSFISALKKLWAGDNSHAFEMAFPAFVGEPISALLSSRCGAHEKWQEATRVEKELIPAAGRAA